MNAYFFKKKNHVHQQLEWVEQWGAVGRDLFRSLDKKNSHFDDILKSDLKFDFQNMNYVSMLLSLMCIEYNCISSPWLMIDGLTTTWSYDRLTQKYLQSIFRVMMAAHTHTYTTSLVTWLYFRHVVTSSLLWSFVACD